MVPNRTWSVAKSIAGTLVGIASKEVKIDPHKPATIPEWRRPGDPRATITLDNLMRILAAAGAAPRSIVNMRVTLRDTADFTVFNETFRAYFGGEKVTRTCFGGIPNRSGINIQIDCVAMYA